MIKRLGNFVVILKAFPENSTYLAKVHKPKSADVPSINVYVYDREDPEKGLIIHISYIGDTCECKHEGEGDS